jgi:DNA-binding transcriptional MerR regulator
MSAVPSGIVASPRAKSAEAFRTISEVATDLDVPQHVLRFWETRFAQVKPVKRAGGRRYYRPEDVDLLRGIRSLLYSDGFTIKGVQKVLRERGLRHVAEVGRAHGGGAEIAIEIESGIEIDDASDMESEAFVESSTDTEEQRDLSEVWTGEATHARAIMADLARAHAAPEPIRVPGPQLEEEPRIALEILLAELLQMKARLRAAR